MKLTILIQKFCIWLNCVYRSLNKIKRLEDAYTKISNPKDWVMAGKTSLHYLPKNFNIQFHKTNWYICFDLSDQTDDNLIRYLGYEFEHHEHYSWKPSFNYHQNHERIFYFTIPIDRVYANATDYTNGMLIRKLALSTMQ